MPSERKLTVLRLLVVGGFAGLAFLAVALLRADSETAGGSDGLGLLDDRAALIGSPAPDFRLANSEGGTIRLGDLRGSPVVINFWATWCVPCQEEMPLFEAAYERADGDLEVVGVNFKEPASLAEPFRDDLGVTFPFALDSDGTVAQRYIATGLPVTYFVDEEGIVRDLRIGSVSEEMLAEKLTTIGVQ